MIYKTPVRELKNTMFVIADSKFEDWKNHFRLNVSLKQVKDAHQLSVKVGSALTSNENSAAFGELETESVFTIPDEYNLVPTVIHAIKEAIKEFNHKSELWTGWKLGETPTDEELVPLVKANIASRNN